MHKPVNWMPQIGSEWVEVLFLLAVPGAQYYTTTTVSHGEEQRCTFGQGDLFLLLTLHVFLPSAIHFWSRLPKDSSVIPRVRPIASVLSVFGQSQDVCYFHIAEKVIILLWIFLKSRKSCSWCENEKTLRHHGFSKMKSKRKMSDWKVNSHNEGRFDLKVSLLKMNLRS